MIQERLKAEDTDPRSEGFGEKKKKKVGFVDGWRPGQNSKCKTGTWTGGGVFVGHMD